MINKLSVFFYPRNETQKMEFTVPEKFEGANAKVAGGKWKLEVKQLEEYQRGKDTLGYI